MKVTLQSGGTSEAEEQILLMQWAAYAQGAHPELRLLHHIPNGGRRTKAEAGILLAMGVKAGVPDLCLPVARGGCHGLYIELKRAEAGRASAAQEEWIMELRRQGYAAEVCHGWEAARETILQYLAKGD